MNDFTKEELQIIHLDMCTYVERYKMLKESPSHKQLREKVEGMIDNYCEHTLESTCCGCVSIWCEKCKKEFKDG